jgi:hypothetical protein
MADVQKIFGDPKARVMRLERTEKNCIQMTFFEAAIQYPWF